ncbi:MAG: leucyl aminopeptidase, partial [Planctomycetota bacterium]|nr:leucyl aminopeptidase [Planctomycetota bacterium]
MIQIEHRASDPLKAKLDVLYVLAVEGEELHDHYGDLAPTVNSAVANGDFTGKAKQVCMFYCEGKAKSKRLGLVGTGRRGRLSLESIRRSVAKIWDSVRGLKVKNVGVVFDHIGLDSGDDATAAAIAESLVLSSYRFMNHKTVDNKDVKGHRRERKADKTTTKITLYCSSKKAKKAIADATAIAIASNHTRRISDEPGNIATPTFLAEESKRLGKEYGFKVKVLEEKQMAAEGMGSLLAVSRGSREPAKLIIMEHKPKGYKGESICLVGKGLTFDAGGISIKPADKMWEMKYDKCGGTAVIGMMCAIAALKLPIHVYGVVPASENMPDGDAVKPGDIVRSMTGHTIEILNTDAEGRLILADALGYCHRLKPAVTLDFATLTGACVVALASIRAAVMGKSDQLCKDLMEAGDRSGERVWHMPQDEEYGEMLKSDHADLKNIGGRWGGALTAGYFLSNFVPPDTEWAHIDLAGPAWKNDSSDGKD